MLSVFRFQSLVKHNRKQSLVKHQGKSVPLSDNLVFLPHKVATFFIFLYFYRIRSLPITHTYINFP